MTHTAMDYFAFYTAMYLINAIEGVAFAVMAYDAKNKKAQQISTRTMVGLAVSLPLTFLNMGSTFALKAYKGSIVLIGLVFSIVACKEVARTTQVQGEDDVTVPGLPEWTGKYTIHVATLISGCIALLVAGEGSVVDAFTFAVTDVQSSSCTFQNFLHAYALIPQLLVCRRQGFVSGATARFLFLIGVKHLYEFSEDAWISYRNFSVGKFNWHREFSFMSGNFIAAIILLDFLYLVLMDKKKYLLCTGELEIELPDEEAGSPREEITELPRWSEEDRKQLICCTAMISLGLAGVALELINIWAMAGAGLLFAAGRKFLSAPLLLAGKVEKCVV